MEFSKTLPIEVLMDAVNIADLLPEDDLEKIGDMVVRSYEEDLESRSDWEERMRDGMKLATQIIEEKTFPWEGAANVKYPLITIAAIQFNARAYPTLIPGQNIVQVRTLGKDADGTKLQRADRVSKYMNWQITEKMDNWIDDFDRLLITLPIMGSIFKKTFFDPVENSAKSELVMAWDLVFDYWAPSVEKANRKTHRLYLTNNDIVSRIRAGIYRDVDLGKPASDKERILADEIEGMEPNSSDEEAPREILEQHRFLDLDGDGYAEPYIVVVDYDTREVLRIVARFDLDSITWTRDGTQIQYIRPHEYFTSYIFIPDPNGGNLGLGFGHLLSPINEAANTLINQLLDAGTLSNLPSGFLGSGLRLSAGDRRFKPGEWKVVRASGVELKNNVVPLPLKEPSNVLFVLLDLLIKSGERLSSVTDAMAGDNPPTNQPASTTLAMLEQGLKVFAGIYRRIYRSMTKEFKHIFRLTKQFFNGVEYFTVLDDEMVSREEIAQRDFADDFDISPIADPNLTTEQQKMLKGQMLASMIQFGGNPQAALMYNAEILDVPDQYKQMLVTPPPQQPDPKVVMEQQRLQADLQKMQADIQIRAEEAKMKMSEMAAELELKRAEHGMEMEKMRLEIEKIKAEISRIKADAQRSGGEEPK